uniref:DUF7869 domain-containing protein n=1 Tax=Physcomitrium patens TaxID=3218 RepID=A9RIR0_PHYPA|nr:hypothetical protein PHYPA_015055 [Physcomitrium patens]
MAHSSGDDFEDAESISPAVPECEGLPRRLWITKCVTLYNAHRKLVGEGTCHSVNSDLVLGANGPLGDTQVAVHICKTHSQDDIPQDLVYALVAWPIKLVHCHGASLHDHEAKDNFNQLHAARANSALSKSKRPYMNGIRNPSQESPLKYKKLLSEESINLVSSKVCCMRNCVQPFPREKIKSFREQMYNGSTFQFRAHMKLDVHRAVHRDASGRKMVTVEGINVCLRAWMHISGVSEATFYRYQAYVKANREARDHGNTRLPKPRKHTEQATATLKCILEKEADHMPHRTRSTKSGEKMVSMILPATFQWKDQIPKINEVNTAFGLREVSSSNLSKIRASRFPEFDVKRPGDNFVQCGTCDKYKELRKGAIGGSEQAMKWTKKLEKHLGIARAYREYYYTKRYYSQTYPDECVTIMHDKMDHAKTVSPVFSHKNKKLDALVKLPVSVTGMIAHGHGDVRYAHYGLDIFPHDSNYTIGSMTKLLRDLEEPPKSSSRELFLGSGSTALFRSILKGAEMCKTSLDPQPERLVGATPLPPILNVQMDNAIGENKNRYVFAFWSLLVAKWIFRKVYVNFMIVGHTHDNIDALFGRWNMLLKKENFPTIPALMKSFMDVESIPTIPHLIEEVPDFKNFILGSILDKSEVLRGHTKPQQVKFYLDATGCRKMKYKLFCTDVEWLGEEGAGIKIWKEDAQGCSLWPCGEPSPVPQRTMRGVEDIEKRISGFVKYWEDLCNVDVIGEYRRWYEHLVVYWRNVKDALHEPIIPCNVLREGFWPITRVRENLVDQFSDDGEDHEEFGEDDPYVGPLRGRPQPSFRVGRDVREGYFVAIRPAEGEIQPVWIARALSNPDCNPEKPNCILIQYFHPTLRSVDVQQFYTGWDSERGLHWKIEENEPPVWEETNALMTAWSPRIRKDTSECVIKIPAPQIEIIKQSLASYIKNV